MYSLREICGYKLSKEKKLSKPHRLLNPRALRLFESPTPLTHGEGSILMQLDRHLLPDTRRWVQQAWPGPSDGPPRLAHGAGMTTPCRGYRSNILLCDAAALSDTTVRNLTL